MNKRKAIPKKVRQSVYLMYNGHCAYCGTEIAYKDMQVDHATPLRIGGADDISNYMPACRSCNHYKATLDVEDFEGIFQKYIKGLCVTAYLIRWRSGLESLSMCLTM